MFSRSSPSPAYARALEWAKSYHSSRKTFTGARTVQSFTPVCRMAREHGARTLLDWGCGKGAQYKLTGFTIPGLGVVPSLKEGWGVDSITPYDPAWPPYAKLPVGKFDGVIVVDVLEYINDCDLSEWVLDEIFGFATKFVFAHVSAQASTKIPAGVPAPDARPLGWWLGAFIQTASRHPTVDWAVEVIRGSPGDSRCWRKDGVSGRTDQELGLPLAEAHLGPIPAAPQELSAGLPLGLRLASPTEQPRW